MPPTVVNDYEHADLRAAAAGNTPMQSNLSPLQSLPSWLPDTVRLYLDHTEDGLSYRELARREGRHASTVMRAVRRYETRRDDPLFDDALAAVLRAAEQACAPIEKEETPMTAPLRPKTFVADEATILSEGKRILRRLVEPGAVLAFAPDMEKAVVMREFEGGRTARTAVVDRTIAQAFALKDWITCRKPGRVATYDISTVGRAALKRMIETEAATPFGDQHRSWAEREVEGEAGPKRIRYNLAESPVAVLGRRRDKDGKLYLEPELVTAAERLREDFELAQMGPRVAQNWERFLTGGDRGGFRGDTGVAEGPRAARDRVAAALRDLGPAWAMWRCGCVAFWKASKPPNSGWAGQRGLARWCCASRYSVCACILMKPMVGLGR